MNANEVLVKYQYYQGQRDFRGLNLRGANFQGQNLSDADFSYCDLQGANFRQANLTRAKFRRVKTGLSQQWSSFLSLSMSIVILISSCLLILPSYTLAFFDESDLYAQILSGGTVIPLLVFGGMTYQHNLKRGLIALYITVMLTLILASTVSLDLTFRVALMLICAMVGILLLIFAFAIKFSIKKGWGLNSGLTLTLGVAFLGALMAGWDAAWNDLGNPMQFLSVVFVFTNFLCLFTARIGRRTIKEPTREPWLYQMIMKIISIGETSFTGAILTDADFTGTMLNKDALVLR